MYICLHVSGSMIPHGVVRTLLKSARMQTWAVGPSADWSSRHRCAAEELENVQSHGMECRLTQPHAPLGRIPERGRWYRALATEVPVRSGDANSIGRGSRGQLVEQHQPMALAKARRALQPTSIKKLVWDAKASPSGSHVPCSLISYRNTIRANRLAV